jgi:hypothetical protein
MSLRDYANSTNTGFQFPVLGVSSLAASGAVTCASVAATGAVTSASVTATGAVGAASVTSVSALVSGASLRAPALATVSQAALPAAADLPALNAATVGCVAVCGAAAVAPFAPGQLVLVIA